MEAIGHTGDTILIDSSIVSWFTTTKPIDCPLNLFRMAVISGNTTNLIMDATTGQISVQAIFSIYKFTLNACAHGSSNPLDCISTTSTITLNV